MKAKFLRKQVVMTAQTVTNRFGWQYLVEAMVPEGASQVKFQPHTAGAAISLSEIHDFVTEVLLRIVKITINKIQFTWKIEQSKFACA